MTTFWKLTAASAVLVTATASAPLRGQGPAAAAPSASAARQTVDGADSLRQAVDRYCVGCHNERRKVGGLVLEGLDTTQVGARAATWEMAVRKLRGGTMPPSGMPRPDADGMRALIGTLEQRLDAAAAAAPDPGRTLVHRLNRAEYTNAIRDLLALELDAKTILPADETGYGFDNIAAVLSVSPGLMERYLSAARRIAALTVGDPGLPAVTESYRQTRQLLQDDRMSEDLPFGSRGGIAVKHYFPLDGDYDFRVKLLKGYFDEVLGLHQDSDIDVRLDGKRINFTTIPAMKGVNAFLSGFTDGGIQENTFKKIEVRVPVKAGRHTVAISLRKVHQEIEGVGPRQMPVGSSSFIQGQSTDVQFGRLELGIAGVDIEGPFNGTTPTDTPSRRALFLCRPASAAEEDPCARRILTNLAYRAYRRPVTEADIKPLMDLYADTKREAGFDRGIQIALRRVLVAPDFLFRMEPDPAGAAPGSVHTISDVALASRLSFFIWSSIPDAELLDLAQKRRLSDPGVLKTQVVRMLKDEKSAALVNNFFSEWLDLRKVPTSRPDPRLFPEFDENLRNSFAEETQLFLQDQLRNDRPAIDLLTADYTFINERLARHYGVSNVYGNHFRRVALPDDRRAGLLGQGGVLMVTSYADRTSPVQRGKWLLQTLLGTPPPEPPPNVPPFPVNDPNNRPKSVRARMEQHRANPVCASCHSMIDPLGFALENFDAIGRWRTADGDTTIDPSGSFPNGTKFSGPAAFREALLVQREAYYNTLIEKMMIYALGRGVEPSDMPSVRKVANGASADDYQWSSIIRGIVSSVPFRQRRSAS